MGFCETQLMLQSALRLAKKNSCQGKTFFSDTHFACETSFCAYK